MLNYYYSGVASCKDDVFEKMVVESPFRLLSCHKNYVKYAEKWLSFSSNYYKDITILFDSGAFTAWNQNTEVHIDELIKLYYNLMEKYWDSSREIYLINLDKIPGSPGRTADQKEMDECEKISDKNYELLVKYFGNRVMPVFHQNESNKRLDEVMAMSDYICISPRNDLPEKYRVKWSKEVHTYIPSNIKTHGLAATGIKMMTEVPWTSVDSAAWLFTASTGSVNLCINGKLIMIGVSSKSPTRHTINQHYLTVSNEVRIEIDKRFNKYGYVAEDLAEKYELRMFLIMVETNYWLEHHHQFEIVDEGSLFGL
ncbi:hypothetical protein UFOVP1516_11 [uncultured Caudovirales phage]|uniref:Uncharacterized protein n=1 Tax=uncultured Caudovirales phage TaxID=2100421 RepID=A0A6J7XA67_9CAUD|nr:hypothetical protein UFOVP887_33 [uncultured Caudovirales phage]CAB5226705.1 hypothetical protein UFOVP1516_11 [uncultured Caudovirales phage]